MRTTLDSKQTIHEWTRHYILKCGIMVFGTIETEITEMFRDKEVREVPK